MRGLTIHSSRHRFAARLNSGVSPQKIMDALTFTAEIIKALAWPIAVVIVSLMVRRPVIQLLPLLRKLKYKEIELEFAKELAQLKSEVSEIECAENKSSASLAPTTSSNRLLNIASISTSAAILEAWSELESVSVAVASSFWAQPPSDAFKNYPKLGEYLLQCKVINEKQLVVFNKLRELRNKAAHAVDLNLTEAEARTYIELATSLIAHIRSV